MSQTQFALPIRRDLRWDFSGVNARFVADDILVNHLWTAFSLGAPGIERFFISALRPLAHRINDLKLKQDMDGMLAQEAMHAATHAKFNRELMSKGVSIQRATSHIDEIVAWISTSFTAMDMVGMVAAGEHMLYSFAVLYLADESIGASMSPEAQRLFEYHMLEEAEHGAVSHDIFRYFCNDSYLHRVRTAIIAVRAINRLLLGTVRILIEDGSDNITWRNWLRFWAYGLVRPGLFRIMAVRLLQYLSPFYRMSFKVGDEVVRRHYEDRLYATQPSST
jgi:predicted metal-dependent hydrolase